MYAERDKKQTTSKKKKTELSDAPPAGAEEIKAASSTFPTDDDGYPLVDGNPMDDRQKQFYDKQIKKDSSFMSWPYYKRHCFSNTLRIIGQL